MSKRKYKDVFDGRCRSEWIHLIDEWVHDDLDRKMMVLYHLDGHTYDRGYSRHGEDKAIELLDDLRGVVRELPKDAKFEIERIIKKHEDVYA